MQQHQINAAGEAFAREFSLALAMSSASPGIQTQADARWVAASFQANSMMQPINSQAERPMVPPPVLANATSQQHFLAAATASAQMSRSSSRSSASEDLRDPLVQHQRHSAAQSRLEDLPGGVGGASDLEDLVDCFRESVEQNLRRSRDRSASRSSSCSTATSRSSSAQCELVTALQNHLKSAVAAAAAAATVAAAANSASHRHNINQINNLSPIERCQQATTSGQVSHHSNPPSRDYTPTLRESSPIPLDLKILPEYEMWHDDDDDELSMSSSRSQDVQHTETVQTTTASNDAIRGPSGGGPSDFSLAPNTCNMAATTLLAPPPPPQPPTTTPSSATGHQTSGTGGGAAGGHHIKQRRLYKCRHCSFETDKKIENWQHIRIHMRPEKLLSCGSCLFVTEYKHHLEYHQRNHTGYKPFKCEHCDYTCVNKSMLNSHMKSHSSVYQYQCGDCKYATKYVHSLKMHLRKYNHQPAAFMIDIFGRKRGPKPGSGRKQQQLKQQRELQQAQQRQQQQSNSGSATAGVTATTTTKTTTANGKAKRQSAARQQQQQQQCILDLRVDSKLAAR